MRAFRVGLTLLLAARLLIGSASAGDERRPKPEQQSGTWLLLAVQGDAWNAGSVERTKSVIKTRCRRLRISCRIERRPNDQPNRMMLHLSTRMVSSRVKEILLAQGVEVRAIVSPPFPDPVLEYWSQAEAEGAKGPHQEVVRFIDVDTETYLILERNLILTGNDLRSCVPVRSPDNFGKYEVQCLLKPAGARRLWEWTSANIERYIAVVFNKWAVSTAYIKAPIGYDFMVSAGFDKKKAQDLVIIFESGNLPASLELLDEGTYSR